MIPAYLISRETSRATRIPAAGNRVFFNVQKVSLTLSAVGLEALPYFSELQHGSPPGRAPPEDFGTLLLWLHQPPEHHENWLGPGWLSSMAASQHLPSLLVVNPEIPAHAQVKPGKMV